MIIKWKSSANSKCYAETFQRELSGPELGSTLSLPSILKMWKQIRAISNIPRNTHIICKFMLGRRSSKSKSVSSAFSFSLQSEKNHNNME